ncbi:hypothetical protein T484DRAFT_1851058 [Baffinella frigidus]|nr:hypothetical protein T484DRAFT_1851058 [Cryptophyta sp. CCMP2293]
MLLAAARSGNVSEVEKLARIDPSSVLETNEQGWSAAHYAARNGKLEMLQCLFRLDPNVLGMRTRNETEETPAHKAALNANKDVQSTREMFAWMHNVDPLFLTVEDGMGRSTIKVLSDTLDRSETDTLAWLHPEAAPSLAIPGAFAGGAEVLAGGAVAEAAAEGADSVTGRGAEGETGVRFESIASPLDGAAAATAAGSVYAATRPGAARGAGLEADSVERVAVVASLARDGAAGCGTSNSGATPPASLPTPPFRQDEHLEHPPPHGGGQDDVEGDSSEREWRDAELREIQAALSEAFGAEASTQMMTAWKLNNSGDFFSVVQHSTEDGLPMDYGALAAQEKRFVDRLLRSNQTMNAEAMELAVGELRGTKWAHFDVYEVLALAGSRSDGDNVLVRATLRGYAARLAPTAGWDPVVLLAAARAAEVQGWSDELRHNLLALYVTLFQKQAEALMSQQDRAFLGSSFRKAGGSSLLSSPGSDAPSYAEGEWAKLRTTVRSPAMDKLMKMIGLQVVKIQAVAIGKKLLADQKLSAKQRVSTALNFCFMGNPGTGKTEVARLFGQMLHEIGVRKSPPPITERTGQQMVQDGAMKADADIANAMDGVLFIDEAHSLDPGSNKAEGKAIVTKLLKAAEDHRERITIILAGYQNPQPSTLNPQP